MIALAALAADVSAPPPPDKPLLRRKLRVCWSGAADPDAGDVIASRSGRVFYLVEAVRTLHEARRSPIARIEMDVISLSHDECEKEDRDDALPWAHTDKPDPNGPRHPVAAMAVKTNKAKREKAERKTVRRATTLMDAMRHPSLVEPVRLPPERPGEDETPRAAGELDAALWPNPDKGTPTRPEAPTVQGYRTADVLVRMARRPGTHITRDHIRAANKVRLAYDIARLGLSGSDPFSATGGGASAAGPKTGHGAAAEQQVYRAREYARVLRAIGESRRRMFIFIVLHNRDICAWVKAETPRLNPPGAPSEGPVVTVDRKVEMGKLVGVLDTLTDFYRAEMAFDVQSGDAV